MQTPRFALSRIHKSTTASTQLCVSAFLQSCILALPVLLLAQQPDRAGTEAMARRATERLQALHREADRLASEEKSLLGELRKLEIERAIKSEELRQIEGERAQIEAELTENLERMRQLQEQDLAVRPELRARLVEVYKLGRGRYLRLLLSTSDLRQVGRASRMVAALAERDRARVESHQRTLEELKQARASLEDRNRRIERLRTGAAQAKAAVERAVIARNELILDIDRRRDLNAQLVGELEAAQQKLQLALRDLASGAPAATDAAMLPLRPFRGDLDWPVAGSVRTRFGRPAAGRGSSSNGIAIAALEGSPVQAIHEGTVAYADSFGGFGNLVILDHGGRTFSLYGNLLDIAVRKGVHVGRGERIGSVGAGPTGPSELYFELRVDGQPVDPLQWLRQR